MGDWFDDALSDDEPDRGPRVQVARSDHAPPGVWITKAGCSVLIADMNDRHLANAVGVALRQGWGRKLAELHAEQSTRDLLTAPAAHQTPPALPSVSVEALRSALRAASQRRDEVMIGKLEAELDLRYTANARAAMQLPTDTYRRKPGQVHAWRYAEPLHMPAWVIALELSPKLRFRRGEHAIGDPYGVVNTGIVNVILDLGDWLVQAEDGTLSVMKDQAFLAAYEPHP